MDILLSVFNVKINVKYKLLDLFHYLIGLRVNVDGFLNIITYE